LAENKWGIDLDNDGMCQCPRCARNGRDRSKNNLRVYAATKSAHCFSCGWTLASEEHKTIMGWDDEDFNEEIELRETMEYLTDTEIATFKSYTGESGKEARGISDSTYKHYAVRTKYDQVTGEPHTQYYPYFEDGSLAGLKVRVLPKTFSSLGHIGSSSELFGLFRYKNSGSKICCLSAGEIDCMSLRESLVNYSKSKGNSYEETPCVSMTNGESSSGKQLRAHYEWFDRFEKIIYFADQDDAGQDAIPGIIKSLPQNKVFIAKFNGKDVNELFMKGREGDIISSFFNAKKFVPKGIVGSGEVYDKILEEAMTPKLEFPPFMRALNELTGGGISTSSACAISASTGLAKSTIINEAVYYWLFNSPHKIGAVSMEQSSAQYGELMLSRHCGRKIGKMKPEEKLEYLRSDYVMTKQKELFFTEDGSHRWHILDERDESIEGLQSKIMELIVACECRVVVLDTLSDILDNTSIDVQQGFTKWIKSVMNKHGTIFLLICHQRKAASGQKDGSNGAMGDESSVQGSSTIVKSVALNIMLARNKLAEDVFERNVTTVALTKNRTGSDTSNDACKIYYDSEHHRLYALEDWQAEHPAEF
jgi:twinkle protein